MPQGLQIFDAQGNTLVDTNTRIGTVLGQVNIGTTNGYVANAAFSNGTPFWFLVSEWTTFPDRVPKISVSQVSGVWRLNWTWPVSGYSGNAPCRMVYGVY